MTQSTEAPPVQVREVLPFYVIVDVSLSMVQSGGLKAANEIAPKLVATFAANPLSGTRSELGCWTSPARATWSSRLATCSMLNGSRVVGRGSGTKYSEALGMLRETIAEDVAQLRADGMTVNRPAVFFVSDGKPFRIRTGRRRSTS